MKLNVGCELDFESQYPINMVLMLRPRSGHGQRIIQEEYLLEPSVPVSEYTDSFGNLCQRLINPGGLFKVKTSAIVEAADEIDVAFGAHFVPVERIPDEILTYMLPSRYCESDKVGKLALDIVQGYDPGYNQVEAIRQWIYRNIAYEYGNSNSSTSAADIVLRRIGVCRDFSHLGIALCRSLNMPSRMVVGYLYQLYPMDLHAWFETYVGGRWYAFDATQAQPKGNRVVIAYGRDAADVALATQFGPMFLVNMKVWVESNESAAVP